MTESSSEDDSVLAALTYNLTAHERQLWMALLAGTSFRIVASKNGLTRSGVYRVLRGTASRPDGMVTKNAWVARWWAARRLLTHS